WVFIVAYIAVGMSFVKERRKEILCHDIKVEILDSLTNGFITVSDIEDFFHETDMNIIGSPVTSINTKELERKLKQYASVKNSEVYVTLNGDIRVEIDQRNPILRVINKRGLSYYIDQEGTIMPLSSKYSSHVLVANGNIIEHYEVNRTREIYCNNTNEEWEKNHLMCDLYELSKFIYENDFWRAQIEQIYINDEYEFELIPRVGAHIIYFGGIEDYETKFRNLRAFYLQGLNNVGWNKYETISLKFENQVICTKR
ncbi:cell division protein FtsQ/DivIB, partial [Bacteroidota bacterium]